jgi:hypothetical protein
MNMGDTIEPDGTPCPPSRYEGAEWLIIVGFMAAWFCGLLAGRGIWRRK